MSDYFNVYAVSIVSVAVLGILYLAQLLIADIAGIISRHTPGYPIVADHDSFLFRASRAHANSNESAPVFILLFLFGMFSAAPADYFNLAVLSFVVARMAHMLCYYANLKRLRSLAFGIAIAALIAMFCSGLWPWL